MRSLCRLSIILSSLALTPALAGPVLDIIPGFDDYPDSVRSLLRTRIDKPAIRDTDGGAPGSDTGASVSLECHRIADKLGSVNLGDCLNRFFRVHENVSVNGAPILYKEYPPLSSRQPLGRVLLVGGIHGDEYSSVSIIFKWMKTLDQHHSGMFHWHVVPLINPDGLLRKESQRMNANNVDLNRNFPMQDWEHTTHAYWVNVTQMNPRRYPGSGPLSEPESKWLAREIDEFKPDVIVSVHAPHGVVDYDGPKDGPHKLGRLYLQLIGTFPGSLGNYAGIQKKIPVVTIELPYSGIMPSDPDVAGIWTDLVAWLRKNINLKTIAVAQRENGPGSGK